MCDDYWKGLDPQVRAVMDAALARLRAAGVQLVELDMPGLEASNAAVGMPVCLYEQKTDLADYLARHHAGVDVEQVVSWNFSPRREAIFQRCHARRAAHAFRRTAAAAAAYERAMAVHRGELIEVYRRAFQEHRSRRLPATSSGPRPAGG